jgi:uncharacterized membrane protein YgcG
LPYAYVSTKFKWIVKRVQEWSSEENTTKLVVVSSSIGTLAWLYQALYGLRIPSTPYRAENFDQFLANHNNRVLLLPISAIQIDIVLPPSSEAIVAEAAVFDVKQHIFRWMRTVGDDTLLKTILIAQDTVEEEIMMEPHFPDFYNSYGNGGTFLGPLFNHPANEAKLVGIMERIPEPVFLSDESEEGGWVLDDSEEEESEDEAGGGGAGGGGEGGGGEGGGGEE